MVLWKKGDEKESYDVEFVLAERMKNGKVSIYLDNSRHFFQKYHFFYFNFD